MGPRRKMERIRLEPEKYHPDIYAWVKDLEHRGLLYRPEKNQPTPRPDYASQPPVAEGSGPAFEQRRWDPEAFVVGSLVSVPGNIGFHQGVDSFFANYRVHERDGAIRQVTWGGTWQQCLWFDNLVDRTPEIDWSQEGQALWQVARYLDVQLSDLTRHLDPETADLLQEAGRSTRRT